LYALIPCPAKNSSSVLTSFLYCLVSCFSPSVFTSAVLHLRGQLYLRYLSAMVSDRTLTPPASSCPSEFREPSQQFYPFLLGAFRYLFLLPFACHQLVLSLAARPGSSTDSFVPSSYNTFIFRLHSHFSACLCFLLALQYGMVIRDYSPGNMPVQFDREDVLDRFLRRIVFLFFSVPLSTHPIGRPLSGAQRALSGYLIIWWVLCSF